MSDTASATAGTADTGASAGAAASTTTAGGQQQQQQQQQQPAHWSAPFDDETKGWVQNRGLDKLDANAALAEAIKGHREIERHIGVPATRLLKLPENLTGDDMNPIYDRLGRPATADGYEFKAPDGRQLDENFVGWAKKAFHGAGVSKENAAKLVDSFNNEFLAGVENASAEQTALEHSQRVSALEKEWGAAKDQNVGIAKQAVAALGVDAATIDKLEEVMGYDNVMKFFHNVGSKVREDAFVAGHSSRPTGNILTPEAAKAKIAELRNDEAWRKSYLSGDVEKRQQFDALHQQAYPAVS